MYTFPCLIHISLHLTFCQFADWDCHVASEKGNAFPSFPPFAMNSHCELSSLPLNNFNSNSSDTFLWTECDSQNQLSLGALLFIFQHKFSFLSAL